jgi:PAS domain S-box-containing protein
MFFQVVFVFGALIVVLFYPNERTDSVEPRERAQGLIEDLARHVSAVISDAGKPTSSLPLTDDSQAKLEGFLQNIANVDQTELYISVNSHQPIKLYSYSATNDTNEDLCLDGGLLSYGLGRPAGFWGPMLCNAQKMVYYYRFDLEDELPAMLVATYGEDVIVSNRPQVEQALLLIFLGAALLSLLMVYVLTKSYRDPLRKLVACLERTATGDIYYNLDIGQSDETAALASAIKKVSEQMRESQAKIKQYDNSLSDANRALIASQTFMATLVDNSPTPIVAASEDAEIMIFNRMASETFGFEKEEAIGKSIEDLFPQSFKEIIEAQESEETKGQEIVCWRKDESLFPAYITVSRISAGAEAGPVYLFMIRDISDSKSYQKMMIRLDRYYTRGEMIGDIAHEINNYLAILMGNVELVPLLLKKNNLEKLDQKLDLMKGAIEKIVNFTDGLMDGRQDEAVFEKTDMNLTIQRALAFLMPQNKFDEIRVDTDLCVDIPPVEADPTQVQQLLVNMMFNAADAVLDNSGERIIHVSTTRTSIDGAGAVRVDIKDNGPGVIDSKRTSLFVKRFTTKKKGHGIGLVTCRKIIDAHNGRIGYDDENGARFHFVLPSRQPQLAQPQLPQPRSESVDAMPESQSTPSGV